MTSWPTARTIAGCDDVLVITHFSYRRSFSYSEEEKSRIGSVRWKIGGLSLSRRRVWQRLSRGTAVPQTPVEPSHSESR